MPFVQINQEGTRFIKDEPENTSVQATDGKRKRFSERTYRNVETPVPLCDDHTFGQGIAVQFEHDHEFRVGWDRIRRMGGGGSRLEVRAA